MTVEMAGFTVIHIVAWRSTVTASVTGTKGHCRYIVLFRHFLAEGLTYVGRRVQIATGATIATTIKQQQQHDEVDRIACHSCGLIICVCSSQQVSFFFVNVAVVEVKHGNHVKTCGCDLKEPGNT
jgi:hypothetical protein